MRNIIMAVAGVIGIGVLYVNARYKKNYTSVKCKGYTHLRTAEENYCE